MSGVPKLLSVPRNEYEDVLGQRLPLNTRDPVTIDLSGFSPEISDVVGQDYIYDRLILFDTEQLLAEPTGTSSAREQVRQDLADDAAFHELVEEYGPIGLTYDVDVEDGLSLEVRYDPEYSSTRFAEASELYRGVTSLDAERLQDEEHVAALAEMGEADTSFLEDMFQDPVTTIATDYVARSANGVDTHLFETDDVYAVVVGSADKPFPETDGYWNEQSITNLLEHLQKQELIEPRPSFIRDHMNGLARKTLFKLSKTANDRDDYPEHVARLEQYRQLEDDIPDEYHALQDLLEEDDVSVETDADWVKVRYLHGNRFAGLLDSMHGAHDSPHPVRAWKHSPHQITAAELEAAYDEWGMGYSSAESHVPDGGYGAETIQEFLDETDISGDDGYFLSALINNMEDDEIVLDDMEGVNRIGAYLQDKHIIVESDVGEWPARNMQSGTLEIKGKVDRGGLISPNGGTVYLHRGGRVYHNHDATVYKRIPLTGHVGAPVWRRS